MCCAYLCDLLAIYGWHRFASSISDSPVIWTTSLYLNMSPAADMNDYVCLPFFGHTSIGACYRYLRACPSSWQVFWLHYQLACTGSTVKLVQSVGPATKWGHS